MVPTTISISVSIRQEVHSLVSKFESTMTDDVQATPVTSNCWRDGPKSEILTLVLPPKAARFSSVNESPIVMQVVENKYSNVGDQQTFGLYPDRTVNLKQRNLIEICNSEQDFIVKCCFCFSRIICAIVKLQLRSALIHNRKVIQKKAEKLIVVSQCCNNQHRIAETAESRDKTFERANRCVSGISNYGQTCFLNSVLQALASLECFIEYLKLVETIGEEQTSSPTSPTLSETMLNLLLEINGERENKTKIDPRSVLQSVSSENSRFQAKFYHLGKEQQDAQELLQAISNLLVQEINLGSPFISSTIKRRAHCPGKKDDESITLVSEFHHQRRRKSNEIVMDAGTPSVAVHMNAKCSSEIHNSTQLLLSPSISSSPKSTLINSLHGIPVSEQSAEKNFYFDQIQKLPLLRITTERSSSKICNSSATSSADVNLNPTSSATSAIRILHSTLSPISPSPLAGWYGSAILCKKCHHVRPIQNTQFFDLPVVPTDISNYLFCSSSPRRQYQRVAPCRLEDCLINFSKIDHIQEVECRNCTIQAEIRERTCERDLLQDTIASLLAKRRKEKHHILNNSALDYESDEFKDLKAELLAVENCLNHLLRASPDDERSIAFGEEPPVLKGEEMNIFELPSSENRLRMRRTDACKCLFLSRLPAILAIHVQRRYYDPATGHTSKTFQHVIFPEILDMSPYCAFFSSNADGNLSDIAPFAGSARSAPSQSPSIAAKSQNGIYYKLMSVIEHRGGAEGGHYVCFRRDVWEKKWLFCSDDVVKPCDWGVVQQAQAYMLFYEAL